MRYQLDTDKYVMISCQDVQWFFSTYKIEQRRIADIRPTSLDYMIRNLDRYGIYSLRHKKVLFEATFTDVDYIDIGDSTFFQVKCPQADGKSIQKTLDSNGQEVIGKQLEVVEKNDLTKQIIRDMLQVDTCE